MPDLTSDAIAATAARIENFHVEAHDLGIDLPLERNGLAAIILGGSNDEEIRKLVPEPAVQWTDINGSKVLLYAAGEKFKSRSWPDDLGGECAALVAAGSIPLPTGQRLQDGSFATYAGRGLADVEPWDMAKLESRHVAELGSFANRFAPPIVTEEPARVSVAHETPESPERRRAMEFAMSHIGNATLHIAESLDSPGKGLQSAAHEVGQVIHLVTDESDVRRRFLKSCFDLGIASKVGLKDVHSIIEAGIRTGRLARLDPPIEAPVESPPVDVEIVEAAVESKEVITERLGDKPKVVRDKTKMPAWDWHPKMAEPGGILQQISDWVLACQDHKCPMTALATAITAVSWMMARTFTTPKKRGSITCYMVVTLPTGHEKNTPIECLKQIASECHVSTSLGEMKARSDGGLHRAMCLRPNNLEIADEFHETLGAWLDPKASVYVKSIATMIKTLWTTQRSAKPPENVEARKELVEVVRPRISLYGTGVRQELLAQIQDTSVRNGLANRLLWLDATGMTTKTRASVDIEAGLPEGTKMALMRMRKANRGSMDHAGYAMRLPASGAGGDVPDMQNSRWADDAADTWWHAWQDECNAQLDDDDELTHMWARTAEYTLRLATVRALSNYPWSGDAKEPADVRVTIEDLEWGKSIALASTRHWLAALSRRETEEQVTSITLRDKIVGMIAKSGKVGVAQSVLSNKLQRYNVKGALGHAIKDLESDGIIYNKPIQRIGKDGKKKLPTKVWHIAAEDGDRFEAESTA